MSSRNVQKYVFSWILEKTTMFVYSKEPQLSVHFFSAAFTEFSEVKITGNNEKPFLKILVASGYRKELQCRSRQEKISGKIDIEHFIKLNTAVVCLKYITY